MLQEVLTRLNGESIVATYAGFGDLPRSDGPSNRSARADIGPLATRHCFARWLMSFLSLDWRSSHELRSTKQKRRPLLEPPSIVLKWQRA